VYNNRLENLETGNCQTYLQFTTLQESLNKMNATGVTGNFGNEMESNFGNHRVSKYMNASEYKYKI